MTLPSAAPPVGPTPSGPSAAEVATVRAAVAGDPRAFEQLVQSHSRRVFGYLAQLTRNTHDADDLTQQTFIKAHHHLARFDCERPLINWLLTIARRTALNHFRDHQKWEAAPGDLASDEPSPALQLEESERTENLWKRARRVLTAREYEVLWLRYGEDRTIAETAQITGLTKIHVKVVVHRAKARLAKGETTA